jgi:hypothetical protein
MSKGKPLIVDWKGLKNLGWPYSRAQTWRLMADTVKAMRHVSGQRQKVAMDIPNPDPFPKCFKLGPHRGSHPVWRVAQVLAYFEAHGLNVTQDWLLE